MIKLTLFLIIFSMAMGCSSAPTFTATAESMLTDTTVAEITPTVSTQTLAPLLVSKTKELPSATPSPELDIATPVPACIDLYYGGYAQFEIVNPSGLRILVDINDPEKLSSPAVDRDILLTTHTHWDHFNEEFQANFPGDQLFVQTGLLEIPDVVIQGIASSHNEGDRLLPEGGTNYIYIIETAGLRIAHFGDIGQTSLSEEQLMDLGDIDIAITQLNNPYSDMNAENRKGINLMEQLKPLLIIPTHSNLDTVKLALLQWDGYYNESASVQICESDLSHDDTKILLLGEAVEMMRKYVDLTPWKDQ